MCRISSISMGTIQGEPFGLRLTPWGMSAVEALPFTPFREAAGREGTPVTPEIQGEAALVRGSIEVHRYLVERGVPHEFYRLERPLRRIDEAAALLDLDPKIVV